jgi:radical SAM protein with 4Fe4S-binding SPASM domain
LPIAPSGPPSKRRLALLDDARDVDKKWRPIYAVWEITLKCDLACRHCGSRAGHARPDELSTAEAIDLVDQMAALGVKEVSLIGGEAYLREDWLDIVRRIRGHGMICQLTTGGRGLTEEILIAAKDAGLTGVGISIDGLESTHDSLRGVKGSFRSAINSLRLARALGFRHSTNTQINRLSLPELPELLDLLIGEGIRAWQVQLTAAMGRAGDEPEMLLQPHHVLEVMPALAKLKEKCDAAKVLFWAGNNIGYYGPYESFLRERWPGKRRGACGAGRRSLGIEANGDIKGCPSLPTTDYVGGNIRDAALLDIWERAPELQFTRDMKVEDLKGFCRTCYYAAECAGGCHWTSHVLLGHRGNNPYCHHRSLELLKSGERERVVMEKSAPGLPFDHSVYKIVREPWPEQSDVDRLRELNAWKPERKGSPHK